MGQGMFYLIDEENIAVIGQWPSYEQTLQIESFLGRPLGSTDNCVIIDKKTILITIEAEFLATLPKKTKKNIKKNRQGS